jgi:hypothetical protein
LGGAGIAEEKMDGENTSLELLKAEFEQLKQEQRQRIAFRDNMVFVQLAAVGSVGSWVLTNLEKTTANDALLMIPWICIVLGWTYIVNDHAISQIGRYVMEILNERVKRFGVIDFDTSHKAGVKNASPLAEIGFFGWERFLRLDKKRKNRKRIQWAIDELTFVAPGILGLITYCYFGSFDIFHPLLMIVLVTELAALVALFYIIFQYDEFTKLFK